MRLNSISARGYRTLQDLTLDFSRGYCTLSGRNNAGKSCIIRLLLSLFQSQTRYPWGAEVSVEYEEDKTQWVKEQTPIEVRFSLGITREEDPALISFVEKIASVTITQPSGTLHVGYSLAAKNELAVTAEIDGERLDDKAAKEIDKRIKDSDLLFLYNSTVPHEEIYFGRGRRRMFYEFVMSAAERKALADAGRHVERQLRKLAKEHTEGLSRILGRLAEKYDIELSPFEGSADREMPLGINLKDRNVQVPLNAWGSGTQNRTRILMAILQANRIKTTGPSDERITPFVVIEEPESFLHPSAQAEFGRMLRRLSDEFGIQIIATTHSPHMLNQDEPRSNILLERKFRQGKPFETVRVDTDGENWMAPFADHLGVGPDQFSALRPLFSGDRSRVLLVEGSSDQEYFEHLRGHDFCGEKLSPAVEIVPYGGKDTLKNTVLLKFVLSKFDRAFITYDLDADSDSRAALERLGLKRNQDFHALGVGQPGKDCIEGLLPQCVLSAVTGRETDLVMALSSRDASERRTAKESLKRKYLAEFKSRTDYSSDELREIGKIVRLINLQLAPPAAIRKRAAAH
jgi:putative ATP-dependent endonuclease of the OLD family